MTSDSDEPPASTRTVVAALEAQVAERPDSVFLRYQDETYTYAEVDQEATVIANELQARGASSDDVIGVLLYNCPEYLLTLFAVAKLGAIGVPIDTRFSGDSLAHILEETGAQTIIFGPETQSAYENVRQRLSSISREYYVGSEDLDRAYQRFTTLRNGSGTAPSDTSVDGSDPFLVTYVQRQADERPKGVVLPHFSYVNTGWECAHNLFGFTDADCIFTTLPLFSSYPLQIGVTGAMLAGGEFAFARQFHPEAFWTQVTDHGATAFLYLDRMLSVLHNRGIDSVDGDNPLRLAIGHGFGFETDQDLITRFEDTFDVTVAEGYGVTATATVATFNRPGERKVGSVGRPVSYVDLDIVDENDWPVDTGETGEIVVRSTRPNTMIQGYFNNPQATVEVCHNQWIHTNDIGYLDEDGYLFFVASKENTINRGRVAGRISALEVESIINSHEAIEDSAVVGVTNETGEEEIKAVVVPHEDASVTPVDVCRHCEMRLAYLKVPRYIEIRDALPRSPTGKIRKSILEEAADATDVWDRESGYELSR